MIEVKCDACQNTMRLVDPPEVQELRAKLAEAMRHGKTLGEEVVRLQANLEEVRRERDAQRQCVVVEHECFERERALYKEALSKLAAATEAANVFREVSAGYKAKLARAIRALVEITYVPGTTISNGASYGVSSKSRPGFQVHWKHQEMADIALADLSAECIPDTSPRIEQNDAHWSAGYRSGMKDAALMLRRIANHVTVPRTPERLREDVLAWAETLDDSAQTEKDYPGRIQNPMNVSNVAAGDTSAKPAAETEELQQVRCIECGDGILLKAKPDGRCTDCYKRALASGDCD